MTAEIIPFPDRHPKLWICGCCGRDATDADTVCDRCGSTVRVTPVAISRYG